MPGRACLLRTHAGFAPGGSASTGSDPAGGIEASVAGISPGHGRRRARQASGRVTGRGPVRPPGVGRGDRSRSSSWVMAATPLTGSGPRSPRCRSSGSGALERWPPTWLVDGSPAASAPIRQSPRTTSWRTALAALGSEPRSPQRHGRPHPDRPHGPAAPGSTTSSRSAGRGAAGSRSCRGSIPGRGSGRTEGPPRGPGTAGSSSSSCSASCGPPGSSARRNLRLEKARRPCGRGEVAHDVLAKTSGSSRPGGIAKPGRAYTRYAASGRP